MRSVLFLISLILISCSSQKEMSDQKRYYVFLAEYVKNEYLISADKEIEALSKEIDNLNSPKKEHIQNRIEALKLWPVYHKALLMKKGEENQPKNAQIDELINRVRERYLKLSGEKFPDVEEEFSLKYSSKYN